MASERAATGRRPKKVPQNPCRVWDSPDAAAKRPKPGTLGGVAHFLWRESLAMTSDQPIKPIRDHAGPTTPAEEAAREADPAVVPADEKAKIAEAASREEDA
jgi:hypothetical protein